MELHGKAASKQEAIDKLVALMVNRPAASQRPRRNTSACVLAREEAGHDRYRRRGRDSACENAGGQRGGTRGDGCCRTASTYESLDGLPAPTLIFLIAAPDTEDNIHLDRAGPALRAADGR